MRNVYTRIALAVALAATAVGTSGCTVSVAWAAWYS